MANNDTINEDFFKVIDTPLKAYILGVVVFNNNAVSIEATAAAEAAEAAIADNNLSVSINLNNVKDNDNTSRSISYGYYKDLKDEDKKHYPYFNNIDMLLKHLSKIGDVKYTETTTLTGIIELTITSKSIKDDIAMHLNNESGYLADFVNNADNANICNQFARAYVEKYSSIIYDNINLESVSGKLVIREQAVNMENLSFNTLGGSMKLTRIRVAPSLCRKCIRNLTAF